jgi:membrane-associated HD superfamily phosphohydrolase
MAKVITTLPGAKPTGLSRIPAFFRRLRLTPGLLGLGFTLTALSFLCTYNWEDTPQIYELGDIANMDIISPITFSFTDENATKAKREEIRKSQQIGRAHV